MKHARLAVFASAIAAIYQISLTAAPANAQVQPAKAVTVPADTSATPGRLPSNPQDITGVWEIYPDPFGGEENTFIELTAPEGGPKLKEPYATQWKQRIDKRNAALAAGTPLADRSTLCLAEGTPGIMGAIFPIQFVQTRGQILILAEFLAQTRRIRLDKKMPALDEIPPSFFGYSVGHWEGDTLVVTTLGVREDTEFFEIPHSNEMKITERIRLTEPGYMEDRIVIEDPKVLAEPYKFTYGYRRNDDYDITEYLCEREDPLLKVNADGTVSMKTDESHASGH